MEFDDITGLFSVFAIFLGLPWVVFHYITKWKTAATLTTQDENLLDELHDLARRLDDRVVTIERIMDAENPAWRASSLPASDLHSSPRQPRIQETRR